MTKHKYRLLKNCTRGRKGDVVTVHGNDVAALQRNGVIGSYEIKPEIVTKKKKRKARK